MDMTQVNFGNAAQSILKNRNPCHFAIAPVTGSVAAYQENICNVLLVASKSVLGLCIV